MIWQEWCLVVSAWILAVEFGFWLGKREAFKIYKQVTEAHNDRK